MTELIRDMPIERRDDLIAQVWAFLGDRGYTISPPGRGHSTEARLPDDICSRCGHSKDRHAGDKDCMCGRCMWFVGPQVDYAEHLEARLVEMTREARLSRESTEKAVQREARLRERINYLARVYAVAPGEPRCCSDCAANDISGELLGLLDA